MLRAREQTYARRIFTQLNACIACCDERVFVCEPGGRNKTDGVEASSAQRVQAARNTLRRLITVECQKFPLRIRSTEGAYVVYRAPRRSDFVVPFSVQKHFGTLRRARAHPLVECRMQGQWPLTVPIRYNEQRGCNAELLTEIPQRQR